MTLIFYDFLVLRFCSWKQEIGFASQEAHQITESVVFFDKWFSNIHIIYIIYFYSRVYISSGRNLVFHPVFVYFQYWSPRSYLSRLPQVRILPPRISMRWRRRRGRRDGHFCSPRCIPTGSLLSIPPRFTACTFYRCIWYNYLWFIIMIYDYMIYEIFYILYILIIPCRSSAA